MNFQYKVTVIVPIYNAEEYLRECLNSLVAQTIDPSQMEVLLINDGSTDSSLAICQEYTEKYPVFKLFNKENGGVSAARNFGISRACGKYIMYIDSDDMFTPETIKAVTDYFDTIYDEVDMVTYKRVFYRDGIAQPLHFRYKYLNKTGVFDLEDYPYISQTTLNVAIKNNKDILFDTSLKQGEDQKYVTGILIDKMKLGYCEQGEYKYIIHDGSAVQNEKYSFYMFEQHTKIWEDLFGKFDIVPKYIQGLVLANYQWELRTDCIFPYHYKGEKFKNAMQRIKNLLAKIDVDLIMNHPQIDAFHKHFWLSMKENIHPTVIFNTPYMAVAVDGKIVYKRDNFEIILNKVDVQNGIVSVLGLIKSPVFNYLKDLPKLFAVVNGNRFEIPLFESISSHYKSKAHTNYFWGFRFSFEASDNDEVSFVVKIDGVEYITQFYSMPNAVFNNNLGIHSFVRDGYKLSLNGNIIEICKISKEERFDLEANRVFKIPVPNEIMSLRNKVLSSQKRNRNRIWVYSDHHAIGADNAFYQFKHDFGKNDGVERYYVCDGNKDEIKDLVTAKQRNYLIEYGTDIHKILYLKAEYVIASFIDLRPRIPFANEEEFSYYRDLHQPTVIYLQHGVLHADLRWLQSAERCKADKIVISTGFEQNNLVKNYHYRSEDLLPFGMARYDHIDRSRKPKNRIIFAPSWRSYLLTKNTQAIWEGNAGQLLKSRYLNKFIAFLRSPELADFLEKNDLYLDAKIHPHMRSVIDFFDIKSDRINITGEKVDIEDYKIFITDISSYVFDYAYLNRPIIYFMPDMEEFESGMNHYRKLDLPFEKAFGNLVTEPEAAVEELNRIAENDFAPDPVFKERMDNFYLPLENCEEKLYQYLIEENEI